MTIGVNSRVRLNAGAIAKLAASKDRARDPAICGTVSGPGDRAGRFTVVWDKGGTEMVALKDLEAA